MTHPTDQRAALEPDTREWALESADLVAAWNAFRRNIDGYKPFEKPMAIAFEAGFMAGRRTPQ